MLEKIIELQVPLLHQNVTEYWVNLSLKKSNQLQVYLLFTHAFLKVTQFHLWVLVPWKVKKML
jgi:hypothetical protein